MSGSLAGGLFYRRLASPLHATRASVGALWTLALVTAALVLYHPVVLGALALATLGAGAGAGVGRRLARMSYVALILALPIVAINTLVTREGLTVFVRLGDLGPFGQGNLTVEAVVYGAVIAEKVALLMLITTLASLAVDPDELLRGVRRLSFRSALTVALATRMLPVLGADAHRVAEAQRTRPEAHVRGLRARAALVSAIVGGSLDRATEVAATLELRGFALAGAPRRGRPRRRHPRAGAPWSRHDLALACSAGAVIALALVGRLTGGASFVAYPSVQLAHGIGTWALSAALAASVLLPFADRRGIAR